MTTKPSTSAMRRLDRLVGDWEMRASVDGRPTGGGRTTFDRLEGGTFLIQHADATPGDDVPPEWVANSPFPVTAVIGLDDASETFYMMYADARGIHRVYRMSLDGGVWKIWGQPGPEFHQRFTGTFSADGNTITAFWEKSQDGIRWERDFDLTYLRTR